MRCLLAGLCLVSQSVTANDWFTLETEHFLIHYEPAAEPMAKRTAGIAEQVHAIVSKRLNWVPRSKTHLVVSNAADLPNAFVVPFPYNRSVLFLSPPIAETAASLMDYGDWWRQRILHVRGQEPQRVPADRTAGVSGEAE